MFKWTVFDISLKQSPWKTTFIPILYLVSDLYHPLIFLFDIFRIILEALLHFFNILPNFNIFGEDFGYFEIISLFIIYFLNQWWINLQIQSMISWWAHLLSNLQCRHSSAVLRIWIIRSYFRKLILIWKLGTIWSS